MSYENQVKWVERVDKDLVKVLETTKEYKAWQESLIAIIGYSSDEEIDEKLVMELLADHLNASFELQKGLENARHKKRKMLQNEWLLDNCGE
jgi:hypothetical protein